MGVRGARRGRGRLARRAAGCPHVLLVVCPGATGLRLETEAALAALGGVRALSPADADVLLVVGEPSAELRRAAEVTWSQLPGPRVRGVVAGPGRAEDVLRRLVPLLGSAEQEADAADRDDTAVPGPEGDPPGGLPMADRAEDRDGLTLDVLRVALGPVLPHWPAGLVVDTRLQGDVVQSATARVLRARAARGPSYWAPGPDASPDLRRGRCAASHLDALARLLSVTGWAGAASGAVALRDRLLAGEAHERVRADFRPWRRRVEGSRLLRWCTRDLGVLLPADARRLGVGGPAARAAPPHDVSARLRQWLVETDAVLGGAPPPDGGPRGEPAAAPSSALLGAAVELLPGRELAEARTVLASFDPDPDEPGAAPSVAAGAS
ncbi:hypothetical protein IF129_14470 [Streptomyces chumphonensis]|uniref:Uncharacterized protein n=1 Tax=Streptomyces chumphonensis TaxID=1214925 RepID=A0A927F091_9ACTN|nr:hypothetical protein [Streptomyces chumphonensis]MBD3932753.1 hypothetical protein [Streptomyces chumphonensis]